MKENSIPKDKHIINAYDIITAIWCKQDRVIDFDLCYGDGTRFTGLTKAQALEVWATMTQMLSGGFEKGWNECADAEKRGEI